MTNALFIAVEGIDGSGKTTIVDRLSVILDCLNKENIVTRDPGGTTTGVKIKSLIMDDELSSAEKELFYFCVAREMLYQYIIEPKLKCGISVISDRFDASTMAYQCHGSKIKNNILKKYIDVFSSFNKPDINILLKVDPKIAASRIKNRTGNDRYDKQNLDFYHRVQSGYLELASKNPEKWMILNANTDFESVLQELHNNFLAHQIPE